jgi:DNA-binding response OmpR family regulator
MSVRSILIVEDEPDVRDVLTEILTLFGYQVTEAADGPHALRQISDNDFDLIITDLGLPGMDGAELSRKIRQKSIETPIIVVTGVELEKSQADFRHISNCCFIQKPFKIDELRKKITKYSGITAEKKPISK